MGKTGTDFPLETEYLELLNQCLALEDVSQFRAMDRMRAALHRKLMLSRPYAYREDNDEYYRRSKYLMSNLDVLLGFNPPQTIGSKAKELHKLLFSEDFQAFLESKTDTIKTQYGQVSA